MNESTAIAPSSQSIDLHSLRSRIAELRDIQRNSEEVPQICSSEVEEILNDCALQVERKINEVWDTSDINSLSPECLEEFLDHLKKELSSVEDENVVVQKEIEDLSRRFAEDNSQLESELEGLSCSLDFLESEDPKIQNWDSDAVHSTLDEDGANSLNPHGFSKIEILELNHQIEKKKTTLKALQDLDCKFKKLEGVEKIEDAFSGVKVIEFEGNCIRLSLKTYIPKIEGVLAQQKVEGLIESLEQNHELLVELEDGTMELKHTEIFPNDVYIGEIIGAAKSFRKIYSPLPVPENRSSLEWFVRRVQDRIVLSTLRRFVVKCSNKSRTSRYIDDMSMMGLWHTLHDVIRHSFEYLDQEEIILAHMIGGIDAFIKVPQGWPICSAALDLMTLKSSSSYLKESSLSKVVELANSLDAGLRQTIPDFVDRIEAMLLQ